MKLWAKQTLVALTIILLSFSLCLYWFVFQETNRLLEAVVSSGKEDISLFCEHLTILERTESVSSDTDPITRRSLIQFVFSTYARLLQNREQNYSLVEGGEYLYHISTFQPMTLLPMDENSLTAHVLTKANGVPLLVSAKNITLLHTPVTVYLIQNISGTLAHIRTLTRTAQLTLGICLIINAILLAIMLRRSLKPLRRLTQISERIAGGEYALRSNILSSDEVGDLSNAFDHMADTVEQKILDLENTSKRRELLLGALTHEIKTPMTAIVGFSDSLLTMPLTEENKMQAAYEIHEAALRTERLCQKMMQLIAMSDCPAVVRRLLLTDTLFQTVKNVTQAHLTKKQITLSLQTKTETIFGDSDLLTALLTNLIDNAAKASEIGKNIELTADETADAYLLTVKDEGNGIPADHIAWVTEPFYRVDKARSRQQGGAGLGLTLCKMIAQAHHGSLHIESAEGTGTCITVTLPKEDDHE
ncbi:MAG: HAMP domain-containing histidine kinase [Clostridiales bacterium]|nr:HAMP domain-containing histidine kinase [Clostridiales bacterium]